MDSESEFFDLDQVVRGFSRPFPILACIVLYRRIERSGNWLARAVKHGRVRLGWPVIQARGVCFPQGAFPHTTPHPNSVPGFSIVSLARDRLPLERSERRSRTWRPALDGSDQLGRETRSDEKHLDRVRSVIPGHSVANAPSALAAGAFDVRGPTSWPARVMHSALSRSFEIGVESAPPTPSVRIGVESAP
jgi:hypothetical protein